MATSVTSDFVFGTKDVAVAGTALVLDATEYRIRSVMLIAHDNNAGRIFYGASDVTSATQRGLAGSESITLSSSSPFALSTIYIDADIANDGVDFIAVRV